MKKTANIKLLFIILLNNHIFIDMNTSPSYNILICERILIIAHDLAMLQHVTTDIGVMYLGTIVETGKTDMVFDNPLHPYTKVLGDGVFLFHTLKK